MRNIRKVQKPTPVDVIDALRKAMPQITANSGFRPPQFLCFAPGPESSLEDGLQREVFRILRDARGFFVTSGMPVTTIRAHAAYAAANAGAKLIPSDLTEAMVTEALRALAARGLAVEVTRERWARKS